MRIWWLAVTGLLIVAGGAVSWWSQVPDVRTEELYLDNDSGETLRGRFYLPAGDGPFPGVLLSHGIGNSKENLEPLALIFAQRGFVALAFDFGAHGESYGRPIAEEDNVRDARRVFAALAAQPRVDPHRLAAVGFSMGASPPIAAAQDQSGVRALVALGRAYPAPNTPPRNLLLGAGIYDHYINPSTLITTLRASTGQADAVAGPVYGAFDDGSARRLVFSLATDHPLELWDPTLLTEAVAWVGSALDQPVSSTSGTPVWLRPIAQGMMMVGSIGLVLGLVHGVLGRLGDSRLRRPLVRRVVAGVGVFGCVVPVLLSVGLPEAGLLLSDIGVSAVVVLLVVNALLFHVAQEPETWYSWRQASSLSVGSPSTGFQPVATKTSSGEPALANGSTPVTAWQEKPRQIGLPLLGMFGTFATAWFLSMLIYRCGYLWQYPAALLAIPQWVGLTLSSYPALALHKFRMLLFAEYSQRLVPSAWWFALLTLEVLWPGVVLSVAIQSVEQLWRWLQRRRGERSRSPSRSSLQTLLVRTGLVMVLIVSGIVAAVRTRGLDTPAIRAMAVECSGFVGVLVIVLLVLIWLIRLPDAGGVEVKRRDGDCVLRS